MIKWFMLYLFFSTSSSWCQKQIYNRDSIYNKQTLLHDFDELFNTLPSVHPSLFDFISKEALENTYKRLRGTIKNGTELDLLERVSNLLVKIGCGHTVARPSANFYNKLKGNVKLISLAVKLIEDDLYIWNHPYEDSISLRGCKITHINGLRTDLLLKKLRQIIPGDGFSGALANHGIEKNFRTYYAFLEGFENEHQVIYTTNNGRTDSILLLPNMALSEEKPVQNAANQFLFVHGGVGMKYHELKANKKIALLDIDGFKRKDFKQFYKLIFKRMSTNQTSHLIIDLRNNGGGYFPNGNELLTYLMTEDVYFTFSRPDTKLPKNKFLQMNTFSKLTKGLFGIIPDKNKDNDKLDYQIKYKLKKKNKFLGSIYVLINNGSFSLSGFVAAKLNTLPNVTFIGQETGGGEYGSNAVLSYTLTLPHTKIRVNIPYYFVDHQISNLAKGSGILPDHEITYSMPDYLTHKDLEIEMALKYITSKP